MFDRKFTIQAFSALAPNADTLRGVLLQTLETYTVQELTNESKDGTQSIIEISFGFAGELNFNEPAFVQQLAGRVTAALGINAALVTCVPMSCMVVGPDGCEIQAEAALLEDEPEMPPAIALQ